MWQGIPFENLALLNLKESSGMYSIREIIPIFHLTEYVSIKQGFKLKLKNND
jgi:hypothetical protein